MKKIILVCAVAFSFSTRADPPSSATPAWTGHWTFDNTLSDASGNGQDAYAV